VLQALSTPAIALLALVIGYFQWRTSQQRAVFELFEKRMAVYDAVVLVMREVVREGAVECRTKALDCLIKAETLSGAPKTAMLRYADWWTRLAELAEKGSVECLKSLEMPSMHRNRVGTECK